MQQLAKKLRFQLWVVNALFRRYRRMILVSFVGGLILFIIGLRIVPVLAQNLAKEHKIIGLVGVYSPTNLPVTIQRLVSLGLTDIDTSGNAIASLASSWAVSADGKVYVFHLQDNLYWHDGKKFSASDVNYNLRDVEFSASDATTLKVMLKEPFTPLPTFLSKPLFRTGLIGLGSYKIAAIRLKGEMVAYLRLEPLSNDLPLLEIKFYPSETLAKTAFKLGEVNVLDEITDVKTFKDWKNITRSETVKTNQYVGIFFNLENQLLSKKENRQALAFAIEKPDKNRVATPLSSMSWAYTNRIKQYDKDLDQSKKLITTSSATLTLSTVPQYLSLAQTIAASWEAIGVKTKVKVEDGIPQQFEALLAPQEIPPDPDQYSLWHSTQLQTNITHYANPKIDKLLEDGRKEKVEDKRKKIYFDFQRYLVEDAPAIFLFHPTTYTISRK